MKNLYKIGDKVPEDGVYLCVPCGYTQEFRRDALFTTCEACFAGTDQGPDGYIGPQAEFWELMT